MLRDKIIDKCVSHRLRKKAALPKQQNFQINKPRSWREKILNSCQKMRPHQWIELSTRINKSLSDVLHMKKDSECPALKHTQSCNKCGNVRHLEKMCKTWNSDKSAMMQIVNCLMKCVRILRMLRGIVHSLLIVVKQNTVLLCHCGGVQVKLLVHSGVTVDAIDQKLWESTKVNRVNVSQKSSKELFAFAWERM